MFCRKHWPLAQFVLFVFSQQFTSSLFVSICYFPLHSSRKRFSLKGHLHTSKENSCKHTINKVGWMNNSSYKNSSHQSVGLQMVVVCIFSVRNTEVVFDQPPNSSHYCSKSSVSSEWSSGWRTPEWLNKYLFSIQSRSISKLFGPLKKKFLAKNP